MTFTERVAAYFREHPNQWISSEVLMQIGGRMAWRTRVSNCRTLGMVIRNTMTTKPNGVKESWYRYYPPQDSSGAQGAAAVVTDTAVVAPIESL